MNFTSRTKTPTSPPPLWPNEFYLQCKNPPNEFLPPEQKHPNDFTIPHKPFPHLYKPYRTFHKKKPSPTLFSPNKTSPTFFLTGTKPLPHPSSNQHKKNKKRIRFFSATRTKQSVFFYLERKPFQYFTALQWILNTVVSAISPIHNISFYLFIFFSFLYLLNGFEL